MSGYIDRDLALSLPWANGEYDHEHVKENSVEHFIFGLETYKEWLESLPTADVAEVKHGKVFAEIEYIIDNEDLESRNDVTDYQSYVKGAEQMRFQLRKAIKNYGAKMDGGKE